MTGVPIASAAAERPLRPSHTIVQIDTRHCRQNPGSEARVMAIFMLVVRLRFVRENAGWARRTHA